GNASFLGAYLAMIVPMSVRMLLASHGPQSIRSRLVYAASAAFGIVALLTTQSRGAWVGAAAGLLMVGILELRRLRKNVVPALVVGAAAVVLAGILVTVSPVGDRVRSVFDLSEGTVGGRLLQWKLTVEMIKSRPVLGWGAETYAFAFPRFIDAEFERNVGRDVIPDRAHNAFLDMAASSGLLGIAGYAALLLLVLWTFLRIRNKDAATVALAGACVAYLVQLQFSISVPDLDTLFWLLAGIMLVESSRRTFSIRRPWAAVPGFFAVVALLWGLTDLAADRALRDALNAEAEGQLQAAQSLVEQSEARGVLRFQYLQAAGRLHRRVGEITGRDEDFDAGLEFLDRAARAMPKNLEITLDRADLLLSWGEASGDTGLIERSAKLYENILDVDRASSRSHLKLGVAHVQLGREDLAEREWIIASSLAPDSPGPLINLGLLYEQQGKIAEALAALSKAHRLDPQNSFVEEALRRLSP
ncbi:MAG: O-antigen ligase family protein, partial [Acidimicrobiia bacterium]